MDPNSNDEFDDNGSDGEPWDGDQEQKHEIGSQTTSPSGTSSANMTAGAHKAGMPMQKRRRVTRACDECRRKKIKCDGKQPCTHCTVYSYDCTYDQPSNRRRNPAPQYIENLEHRVHRAEALLHILIPNLDLSDPGIDAAVAQGWIPGAPGKGAPSAATSTEHLKPSERPAGPAESKSDAHLESMVRAVAQMDLDEQGNWDYHGHSSGLSFIRRMREQLGDIMGPDTVSTPFVKSRPRTQILDSPRSNNLDSPSPSSPGFGSDLPPRDVAYQLCANAVNDAAVLLRVLHQPSFWKSFDHMYSMPAENYGNDEYKFLPLLYSVMALGTLFGTDENSCLNQSGYEAAIMQGFQYFKSARQMMDIADCRDLTSIQAVVFMILFMQSSAKLSQCYAYVGVALRSALRMGLHRSFVGNFNPIEAETRKRVFWVVRKMDIYVGAMLGLPQTLSDDAIDQDFPSEVDDEYITEEGIKPMPEGVVSLMAAFNAHTKLVILLSKIVRNIYPIKVNNMRGTADKAYSVPFSAVREIEDDLEQWKNSLPPILSPCEAPPRYTRVQQLLRLAYAHAQVMLYRPFLHFTAKRGTPVDQRAYACAASYVNVSRNIIHITMQMKDKGLLNGAFWFIMYTTFFSIMSLIYFAWENPENVTTIPVMQDAFEGKRVLASLATRSMAADRCTATLEVIFTRLPKWLLEGGHDPAVSRKRPARSHDVLPGHGRDHPIQGLQRRAETFPKHVPTKVDPSTFNAPWPQSAVQKNPSYAPTPNGFNTDGMAGFNNVNNTSPMADPMQQFAFTSGFQTPGITDLSTMMFGSENEPMGYPAQPLTTFENNRFGKGQPFANTQNFAVDSPSTMGPPPSRGRMGTDNETMEAQFFSLPAHLTQSQPQYPGIGMNPAAVSFAQTPQQEGLMMANGHWPNQQSVTQDGSINLSDIFGGSEWNSMAMDPGYRQ